MGNLKFYQRFVLVLSMLFSAGLSHSGNVTGAEVWLTRFQDQHGNVDYGFFSDVWGTIDEFQSIDLLTPLGDSFALSLSPEGDQWGADFSAPTDVLNLFTDGIYTFDITYTDQTTDSRQVRLEGAFPQYPANLQLNNNLLTWDPWLNPGPTATVIELYIETDNGALEVDLLLGATSYAIPAGINVREVEVAFRTSPFPSAFKSSASTLNAVPLPAAAWLFGSALIGLVVKRGRRD